MPAWIWPPGVPGWSVRDGAFDWNPNLLPISATGYNALMSDAFTGPTLDPKWAAISPAGNFVVNGGSGVGTLDTARQMLRTLSTGNGALRVGWVVQALPVGFTEGAFITRVHPEANANENGYRAGIILGPAGLLAMPGAAATAFATNSRYFFGGTDGQRCESWIAYNTFGVTQLEYASPLGNFLRTRVINVAGNWQVFRDSSFDGVEWQQIGGAATQPWVSTFGAPGAVGLFCECFTNGVTRLCRFPFFVAFTGAGTSAFDASYCGRAVAIPLQP